MPCARRKQPNKRVHCAERGNRASLSIFDLGLLSTAASALPSAPTAWLAASLAAGAPDRLNPGALALVYAAWLIVGPVACVRTVRRLDTELAQT